MQDRPEEIDSMENRRVGTVDWQRSKNVTRLDNALKRHRTQ